MDNGAYEKYRQENPVVNTFVTTYEHITMFPEQLTKVEIIVLVTFSLIALYAVVTLIYQIFWSGSIRPSSSRMCWNTCQTQQRRC